MHARASAVWCAVFTVVLLTGCTAGAGGSDESPPVEATLTIRSGEVTVETADGQAAGADGDVLAAGDVVTVSAADALAELTWSDGAVTRLGPDTSFTVGAPGERVGARGVQDGGVSWNRVVPADADAEAAITPYVLGVRDADPVSDRGDLFVVDCRAESCRIAGTGGGGADGSKTTFRRGLIETEVVSEMPVSWEALMVDAWAERNAELDEEAGMVPVADLFADAEPSRGVLEGTFDVLRTGRERSCIGESCSQLVLLQPGETRELVYAFHRDCASAGCATTVDTQAIDTGTGGVIDETVPLITGADTFTWGTDNEGSICLWTYEDGATAETGRTANTIRWSVTPTKAEVRDGVFVVTELQGAAEASLSILERVSSAAFPGCEAFEVEWSGASDLVLTRRDG
jgi:hypothetical protein